MFTIDHDQGNGNEQRAMRSLTAVAASTARQGTPVEGTTCWSDELGIDGPPHLLAWVGVLDDNRPQVHLMFDTADLSAAARAAMVIAPDHVGPLTTGIWFATTTDISYAVTGTYRDGRPTPSSDEP